MKSFSHWAESESQGKQIVSGYFDSLPAVLANQLNAVVNDLITLAKNDPNGFTKVLGVLKREMNAQGGANFQSSAAGRIANSFSASNNKQV